MRSPHWAAEATKVMGPIVLESSLALFVPKVTGSTDGLKPQVAEEEEGQRGTALTGEVVVGCQSLKASNTCDWKSTDFSS